MATTKKLMGTTAAAGGAGFTAIEDVFSTYLYTGNGSTQVIENGINLGQAFGSGSAGMNLNLSQDSNVSTLDVDGLFVNNNSIIDFGTGDFTVELWVYAKGSNTFSSLIGGDSGEFGLTIYNGNIYYSSNGVVNPISNTYSGYFDKFTHIAVSRESGTSRLFLDGVLAGSNSSSEPNFTSANGVGIGNLRSTDYRLQGWISNVRVVKGVAVYTSAFTPPTSELTAISGTALLTCQGSEPFVDNSSNSHAITLEGNPQAATFGPFDAAEPGEGGMVWIKARSISTNPTLFDTERGVLNRLRSDETGAEVSLSNSLTSFNSDGFSLGSATDVNWGTPEYYASWTFRKAPRFFDVVTYTGDGVAGRTVSHNLGSVPGTIIVKRTNTSGSWRVYHRSLGATDALRLNLTNTPTVSINMWNNTEPTDSVFSVGIDGDVNASGSTYVAYLFAHDPLGPSGDGSDGLIACGSYTGNSSTDGPEIDLGWEPQWVLVKRSDSSGYWYLQDNLRGLTSNGNGVGLAPNSSEVEFSGSSHAISLLPTGFKIATNVAGYNSSGGTYIYIAIRRGPMRAPESGTEVFALDTQNSGSYSSPPYYRSGFVTDAALRLYRTGGSSAYQWFASRMTGGNNLVTSSTAAEVTNASTNDWDYMNGWGGSGASGSTTVVVSPMFRRAPNFFDVVAYTGDGVAGRTVPHNLGVAPEFMIVKGRGAGGSSWPTYHTGFGAGSMIRLNTNEAEFVSALPWNNTAPSADVFTVGSYAYTNSATDNFIAYLFATLAGVSKVGSYTGNGSSQTINCGFTSGARFILIKRTDSTGDWYVWDTERGIVAGNDPHLSLNTTAAEVTSDDTIDPDSSGFIVNQVAATNVNVSSATYIYLAIA